MQINDDLYKILGDLGFTGSIDDRMYKYLEGQGYFGALNNRLCLFFTAQKYTGSFTDQYAQWKRLGYPLFSPLSLFANGEQGVWYDPSDFTTMFQDSAGTTPVTAVEQPVGLLLDKSKGLELSSELQPNGDFSSGATGWSPSGEWVIENNRAVKSATTTNSNLGTFVSVEASKSYLVTFDIISVTGSITVQTASSSNATLATFTSAGSVRCIITATSVLTGSRVIVFRAVAASTAVIDNVSIKEIAGNHATQPTSTKRPTLSARYNQLVGTTTLATQNVTTVATDYKLQFSGTGSINLTGSKTQTDIQAGNNTISGVTAGTLTLTVVGSVTNAQLVPISQLAIPYQQVTTSTNYDTTASNFPPYLKFDGVDDILNLPLVLFQATENHFIAVGASITNLASTDLFSMTNTANLATGGLIKMGYSGGGGFLYALRDNSNGLTLCDASAPVPSTATVGGRNVLSGRTVGNDHILRVNTQNGTNRNVVINTTTLNVAGVGARPASTNNTTISNQITGNIYSVIAVRGTVSDENRLNTENYVNSKTKAY